MTSTIFTIARQYGSGGRQIGKKIAERLEIPFYDKELIAMAAKQSGMSEAIFEKADEKASSSLIYSLLMGTYAYNAQLTPNDLPVNDKIFLLQTNIIKQVAQKGPCVIVGRCGDYILRDNPNCFNIYVYADQESRVKRAVEEYGIEAKHAAEFIAKKDKQRANYYNFYTNLKWGAAQNYHLTLNSQKFGIDRSAQLICGAAELLHSAP